jgi:ABC-type phosphate transport system substrate-binding protein
MKRRRIAGVALGVAVVLAGAMPLALHARASGPSNASLPDFANKPPVQQTAPPQWGYEVTTGGLTGGDQVKFTFLYNGKPGDRQHAVSFFETDPTLPGLQGSITVEALPALPSGVPLPPVQSQNCLSVGGSTHPANHPASIEVDPYAQTVTVKIKDAELSGSLLLFCFTAVSGVVGFPTSTTPNDPATGYSVEYTEPGGSTSAPYYVTGQASPPTTSTVHVLDTDGSDLTGRGLGGTRPLVYGATYNVTLHGQRGQPYSMTGTATDATTNIVDGSASLRLVGTGGAVGTCAPYAGHFCADPNGDASGTLMVTSPNPHPDYIAISTNANGNAGVGESATNLISVTVGPAGSAPPTPGSVATPTPLPPGATPSRAPFDPSCANPLPSAKGLGSRDVLDAAEQVLIPDANIACPPLSGRFSYTGINDDIGISSALNSVYTDYGFTGLDRSLTSSEYASYTAPGAFGGGVEQFPIFIEPIVVTYNLDAPGCQVSQVNLRSQVLSLIFMGQITTWNNQLILQDNGGLQGCNLPILVAHDIGVTSSVSKRNPQWSAYKQTQLASAWPSQSPVSCTANGSRAMALCVAGQAGMIGYGYYRFINQAGLPIAGLDNASGTSNTTNPKLGFQAAPLDPDNGCIAAARNNPNVPATTSADWSNASLTDPPAGYPLCAFDFVVAHVLCARNVVTYQGFKAFLGAVYLDSTQSDLAAHGFAPLPPNVITTAQQGYNSSATNPNPLPLGC